ncbi:Asp23/Gls24 family envelope stress response protein [Granulicatella sp. zg-ZJ]|uniref:Asp23/Gls24 family envelope stress response protein n=1 Tax=unclassified Granulicatella TaxID=2630493 RepID=UPI0013C13FBF|nr:Asp23/Gls24 family envelope stress response protein [Carnobacteriaceae bacterium zg-ZUI78]NEW63034.1 Asp23/Gls24 family envelope stress response protein [Granulicatella sp. zg-ZJ]NEW66213.1 Asp23/Gls24 family envelope stress response protein [Granulicatella sp. zg-84]QMI85945.1 Asp23/Gls24 family envelope stress response protein [Carnobacteriaceae bacterium zg-84]
MNKYEHNVLGNIEIAPEAIELIIGIAVSKMKRVHSIQGKLVSNMVSVFSKPLVSKGVYLTTNSEGEFVVDIYVNTFYGVSIPKLARHIQERVKEQVLFMCDIDIQEVNVHIVNLVLEDAGESVE